MKRWLPILIVVVLAGGVLVWALTGDNDSEGTTPPIEQTDNDTSDSAPADETDTAAADAAHLRGANIGATVDATDQTAVTVTMEDFEFDPTVLTIKKGTAVTWVNEGDNGHDVTPASNSPQSFTGSSLLGTGDDYSFTFTESGTYYYFCTPHSSEMRAIIKVVN